MLSKNTAITIVSKSFILLANFSLVVFSTHLWGSQGRGEIAMVIANISIITIVSNIFCGSSIAYHVPRQQRELLLLVSFAGAIMISLAGSLVLSVIVGFKYFSTLFLISLLLSLTTTIPTYWLGKNNIIQYNFLTLLNPLFILISLITLIYVFNKSSLETYFLSYYIGTATVLIIGVVGLVMKAPFKVPEFSFTGIKSVFIYGIKNESNTLIQFINSRLSYYFIANILGLSQLGVFSVAISISEAFLIISRSLSAIHFSNVLNSDNQFKNRSETNNFVKQSFWISLLLFGVSVLIPVSVYQFIFGNEFAETKNYLIYLLPGIVAVAVSNLYDQYFSGIGKLKIIRNRSVIGFAVTIILLPLLIKKYQLTGVCVAMNISYILSTIYIWYKFHTEGISMYLNPMD